MRVYLWDKKENKIIDYLAKKLDNFGAVYRLTHYDDGESLFPTDNFLIILITEHESILS